MGKQSRRDFFKTAGLVGAGLTGVGAKQAKAAPKNVLLEDRNGVLVDTTVCIGCRKCEYACKKAHDFPTGSIESYDDRSVFKNLRRPDIDGHTVVNEYDNNNGGKYPINVKVQCMHCDHPACVSACIVGAFSKEENGSVIYDVNKCIGCRYCMVACPFQIPSYEYKNALTPQVQKCDFCFERTKEGLLPACVEMCPVEALTFGKRSDLLKIARERISKNPDKYFDHIYGEKEVGGTSWLYLSSTDFSDLDFPKLAENPAPGVSEAIQHAIFKYFIPPVSLYALLGGIMWINKNKEEVE
ncbi:MAG: 4Fe-4S dicluster domain-containing protein [Calditrichaceae bacterium]